MSSWHTETRGRFRWLETVEDGDEGIEIRMTRTELACGLVVERVTGARTPLVFITDAAGVELTVTAEQSVELGAALGELPGH